MDKIRLMEIDKLVGRIYVKNSFLKEENQGKRLRIDEGDEYVEVACYDENGQVVCYKWERIEDLI